MVENEYFQILNFLLSFHYSSFITLLSISAPLCLVVGVASGTSPLYRLARFHVTPCDFTWLHNYPSRFSVRRQARDALCGKIPSIARNFGLARQICSSKRSPSWLWWNHWLLVRPAWMCKAKRKQATFLHCSTRQKPRQKIGRAKTSWQYFDICP
jgi:hypothetical protein